MSALVGSLKGIMISQNIPFIIKEYLYDRIVPEKVTHLRNLTQELILLSTHQQEGCNNVSVVLESFDPSVPQVCQDDAGEPQQFFHQLAEAAGERNGLADGLTAVQGLLDPARYSEATIIIALSLEVDNHYFYILCLTK